MNFDVAEEDVKQFFPISGARPEHHSRVGINFERAAVRKLEDGAAIRASNNELAGFYPISHVERPGYAVNQLIHPSNQGDDNGGAIRRWGGKLSPSRAGAPERDRKQQPPGAHALPPRAKTQKHP